MILSDFSSRLDEARFRQPTLMYHGTTSEVLRSILKQGVMPFPEKRAWAADDNVHAHQTSRVSVGGSYWTVNLSTARLSAIHAKKTLGGKNRLIVAAMIQQQSAYSDEDSVNFPLNQALKWVTSRSFGVPDPAWMAGIFFHAGEGKNRELAITTFIEKFMEGINRRDKNNYTLPRDKAAAIFRAAILRQLSHMSPNERERILSRYDVEGLHVPSSEEAEAEFLRLKGDLSRTYKVDVYGRDLHLTTLRIEQPVGYRGANHVTAVIELVEHPLGDGHKDYFVLHYGAMPEDFRQQWREGVGRMRPVYDPQGNLIEPGDPIKESVLAETEVQWQRWWINPRTNTAIEADEFGDHDAFVEEYLFDYFLTPFELESITGQDTFTSLSFSKHRDDILNALYAKGWAAALLATNYGELNIRSDTLDDLRRAVTAVHKKAWVDNVVADVGGRSLTLNGDEVKRFIKYGTIRKDNIREHALSEGLVKIPKKLLDACYEYVEFMVMWWAQDRIKERVTEYPQAAAVFDRLRAALPYSKFPSLDEDFPAHDDMIGESFKIDWEGMPDSYRKLTPNRTHILVGVDFRQGARGGKVGAVYLPERGGIVVCPMNIEYLRRWPMGHAEDLTAALDEIKSTLVHELRHMVQFVLLADRDPRQVDRSAGYVDASKTGSRDYLTSPIEFDTIVGSKADEFLWHYRLLLGYGKKIVLSDAIQKYVGAKQGDAINGFSAEPFFQRWKEKDERKWRIAVRKFIQAVKDGLTDVK